MATTKSQRLVNLVLCLRSTRAYLSADQIRHSVQGYEDCATSEAFLRRFERDKRALRDVGVPIDQGNADTAGSPVGYRIAPSDYELPEIVLTPEQAGVLAVAAEVWRSGTRSAHADGALTKLRAGGVDPAVDPTAGVALVNPHELDTAAALSEAAGGDTVITFDYAPPGSETATRTVEPWWTGSRNGHWYLVGYDLDRRAARVFRLSRVHTFTVADHARTAHVPTSSEIHAIVDEAIGAVNPRLDATVWVASGRAAELRAIASEHQPMAFRGRDGDDICVSGHLSELTSLIAAQGADAIARTPPELVDRVRTVLQHAAGATS